MVPGRQGRINYIHIPRPCCIYNIDLPSQPRRVTELISPTQPDSEKAPAQLHHMYSCIVGILIGSCVWCQQARAIPAARRVPSVGWLSWMLVHRSSPFCWGWQDWLYIALYHASSYSKYPYICGWSIDIV
jgi:hypothetical protein